MCFDPLDTFTMFACRRHAVCGKCKVHVNRCPLCRASEAQIVALHVPIDDVKRALGDTAVDFDLARIRRLFRAVRPVRASLSVAQCVAFDALAAALLDASCHWYDLWRLKQLSSHLNQPDVAIDGWREFVAVLSEERTRLIAKTLPMHVDLMGMATPVELRVG